MNRNVKLLTPYELYRRINKKMRLLNSLVRQKRIIDFQLLKNEILALTYLYNQRIRYLLLIWLKIPIIVFTIIYSIIWLWGKDSETEIYADLKVSSLVIDSLDNHSTAEPLNFSATDSILVNPRRGKAMRLYKSVEKAIKNNLAINFTIPASVQFAMVSKEKSKTILYLTAATTTDFSYNIINNTSSSYGQDSSINSFKGRININLFGPVNQELAPITAGSISFADARQSYSYLLSGTVHLLDTKDDSIKLFRENYLSMTLKEKTKFYIDRIPEGFRIRFNTKVSSLRSGYEIGEEINRMPLKIQTTYAQSPYLWLIVPVLLSVLLSFIKFDLSE